MRHWGNLLPARAVSSYAPSHLDRNRFMKERSEYGVDSIMSQQKTVLPVEVVAPEVKFEAICVKGAKPNACTFPDRPPAALVRNWLALHMTSMTPTAQKPGKRVRKSQNDSLNRWLRKTNHFGTSAYL